MSQHRFDVGSVEDFANDTITPLELDGDAIVLIRQHGKFYAMPDRCTHARYPMHDGQLLDGAIRCTYHGAKFDLETGRPTLPAVKKMQLFTVETEDERVYVVRDEGA